MQNSYIQDIKNKTHNIINTAINKIQHSTSKHSNMKQKQMILYKTIYRNLSREECNNICYIWNFFIKMNVNDCNTFNNKKLSYVFQLFTKLGFNEINSKILAQEQIKTINQEFITKFTKAMQGNFLKALDYLVKHYHKFSNLRDIYSNLDSLEEKIALLCTNHSEFLNMKHNHDIINKMHDLLHIIKDYKKTSNTTTHAMLHEWDMLCNAQYKIEYYIAQYNYEYLYFTTKNLEFIMIPGLLDNNSALYKFQQIKNKVLIFLETYWEGYIMVDKFVRYHWSEDKTDLQTENERCSKWVMQFISSAMGVANVITAFIATVTMSGVEIAGLLSTLYLPIILIFVSMIHAFSNILIVASRNNWLNIRGLSSDIKTLEGIAQMVLKGRYALFQELELYAGMALKRMNREFSEGLLL